MLGRLRRSECVVNVETRSCLLLLRLSEKQCASSMNYKDCSCMVSWMQEALDMVAEEYGMDQCSQQQQAC